MDKYGESKQPGLAPSFSSAVKRDKSKVVLQTKIICDICDSPKDVNSFCVNCEGTLCNKCKSKHKDGRISRHHRVIELSRKTFQNAGQKTDKPAKDQGKSAHASVDSKSSKHEKSKAVGEWNRSGSSITKYESMRKQEQSVAPVVLKRSQSAKSAASTTQKATVSEKTGVLFSVSEKSRSAATDKKEATKKDVKPVPILCRHHKKEELAYCNLCCLSCCVVCAKQQHRHHPVIELAVKLEAFNKELEKYTHQLETSVLAEYSRQLKDVSKDLRWYEESAQSTKRDLERDVREVKVKMDTLYDRYLKEVEQKIVNDRSKIRDRKSEIEKKITEISQLIKRCKSKFSSKQAADLEFERECPTLKSFKLTPYKKPVPPTYVPVSRVDNSSFDGLLGKTPAKSMTPRHRNPRSSCTEQPAAQSDVCDYCGAWLRIWEHPLSRHQVPYCPSCILRN